jgi:hypothetical protein
METMLAIFLYSYLYLKVAKNNMSFLLSHVLSSTKLEKKRAKPILPVKAQWWWRGGPNNVYTCE